MIELENNFEGTFTYGNLNDYNISYDIVNIHWPEAIFNWKEPSQDELNSLKKNLEEWQKYSKIITTRHNDYPHFRNTNNFKKLYDLVYSFSEGIIHLGDYSFLNFKSIYTNKKQIVIRHPLFKSIPNTITKTESRIILKINQNAKVILVFGAIRSQEEKKIIQESFQKLKVKNKILLAPRMSYGLSPNVPKYLRKYAFFLIKKYNRLIKKHYFENKFVKTLQIQNYVNAADVILIARKEGLNSGNVFLAYTFKKTVVGPNIGNIGEELMRAGFPVYDFNHKSSIENAIKEGLNLSLEIENKIDFDRIWESHNPKLISKQYLEFFKLILNEQTINFNNNSGL
ncbi:glycosyltransferase family protein [Confluentibacter lentus]|uniref:hypothetical protein n=1 Tax=Confluentibacter lentus TaxID=1699412 RepID=UPI0012FDAA9A|nr:hypothetical protein [Confluentibacter lentus]